MTSYRKPDYDVKLAIANQTFQDISGVAFSAKIVFSENQKYFPGMLIIPRRQADSDIEMMSQIRDSLSKLLVVNAWLWLYEYLDVLQKTKLRIILGEPCDPMYDPQFNAEEYQSRANHSGLEIEGVVTQNWKSEDESLMI